MERSHSQSQSKQQRYCVATCKSVKPKQLLQTKFLLEVEKHLPITTREVYQMIKLIQHKGT